MSVSVLAENILLATYQPSRLPPFIFAISRHPRMFKKGPLIDSSRIELLTLPSLDAIRFCTLLDYDSVTPSDADAKRQRPRQLSIVR